MGKIFVAIAALVVGLVVGGLGGAALGIGGGGAGIAIATGLSAGACGIVQAAQADGLLTDEQVDRVFARALADIREMTGEAAAGDGMRAGGAAEYDAVMAHLRAAAAE